MTLPDRLDVQLTIRNDDVIVKNHQLHATPLLPGVTYIDILYRTIRAKGADPQRVELRNLLFKHPVTTSSAYATRVHLHIERHGDHWRAWARSKRVAGDRVLDAAFSENMECTLHLVAPLERTQLDLNALKRGATDVADMDELYGKARIVDLVHRDFMKSHGRIHIGETYLLGEIELNPMGQPYLPHFYIHPAGMDTSTIVPFALPRALPEGTLKAFIPLYIESFRVATPPGQRFYVYVDLHRYPPSKGDVTYNDIEVYDEQGRRCTYLRKMAAKQVRKSELITNLKTTSATPPSVPNVAVPPVGQPASPAAGSPAAGSPAAGSPAAPVQQAATSQDLHAQRESLAAMLTEMVAELRQVAAAKVDPEEGFYDQGLDSTNLLKLVRDLEQRLNLQLYPTLLFEYSNISELAAYLAEETVAGTLSTAPASTAPASTAPPAPSQPTPAPAPQAADYTGNFTHILLQMVATMREVPVAKVDPDEGFYDQGLDSTSLLKMVRDLEQQLDVQLYPTLLFEYPNITELAEYLAEAVGTAPAPVVETTPPPTPEPESASVAREPEGSLYLRPTWERANLDAAANIPSDLLVLDYDDQLTQQLRARAGDHRVILVKAGRDFRAIDPDYFQVNPNNVEDYKSLATALAEQGSLPLHVVHAWSSKNYTPTDVALNAQLHKSLYAVLFLAQAWLGQKIKQPLHLLHVYANPSNHPNPHYAACAAIAKCARIENPRLRIKNIAVDGDLNWTEPSLVDRVLQEFNEADELDIRLDGDGRWVQRYTDFQPQAIAKDSENPVVLITGGSGGLGVIFARHLAKRPGMKLALAGRSPAGPRQEAVISELEALGATVRYYAADVADRDQTANLVAQVREELGPVTGVIHSAGVIADDYLIKKTVAQVDKVLAAKVYAVIYLDEATRGEPLDWTLYCSSISAVTGNPGQSDYAAGNAFMDQFAAMREGWREDGKRSGKTVSINWPLWREGGMLMDAAAERTHLNATGMRGLSTETGLTALETALQFDGSQFTVLEGRLNPMRALFGLPPVTPESPAPEKQSAATQPPSPQTPTLSAVTPPPVPEATTIRATRQPDQTDIAVIGIAGRYPGAYDVDDFWNLLQQGRDAISEIPLERWDWRGTFSTDRGVRGKIYSKWGGFIEDADKFDPLFFNLPPLSAVLADPQERLFLETVWHTMEDACYRRKDLAGRKVGVYCGVMWNQYQIFGAEETNKGNPMALGSIVASIANKVSYCLNLRGPSMALDTMCSSALTALHLACESLRNGESEMAFAGGVNLSLHPNKYLMLSQNQMVSGSGRCKAFGRGGDGYVPGEGVGSVLLKPLAQAQADGDHIYGVIKASALNHGGKASGYTVPNPKAQAELVAETIAKAGIPPETIGYIETHGTGTELGDPVEITGLNRAFRTVPVANGSIPIGSVKSNIGHCEGAAGVSSLTKTLLQLHHRELTPSIHTRELNDKIDWQQTPFRVQREHTPWHAPTGADGRPLPRRAGISSFGAGGANAHIILEEAPPQTDLPQTTGHHLLVLSAQSPERLRAYAAKVADWIDAGLRDKRATPDDMLALLTGIAAEVAGVRPDDLEPEEDLTSFGFDPATFQAFVDRLNDALDQELSTAIFAEAASLERLTAWLFDQDIQAPATAKTVVLPPFADAAWSFQIGREAWDERLALVAEDYDSWRQGLRAWLANDQPKSLQVGNVEQASSDPILGGSDPEDRAYLEAIVARGNLEKIARLWVRGADVDWSVLHGSQPRRRASVPTYPFARERYWFPVAEETTVPQDRVQAALHPLLDSNESNLDTMRYRKTLHAEDYLLRDHHVRGQVVLPGTAYLEMARAAGTLAAREPITSIRDIVWQRPLVVAGDTCDVFIELFPSEDAIDFEVLQDPDGTGRVHTAGRLSTLPQNEPPPALDLSALRGEMDWHQTHRQAYAAYSAMGFGYGPAYQVTHAIHANDNQALTELRLPEAAQDGADWVLHPCLLDGALRSVSAIRGAWQSDEPQLHIPFALGAVDLFSPVPERIFAHAQLAESTPAGMVKFHINLYDEQGQPVASLRNFAARAVKEGALGDADQAHEQLFLEPVWQDDPLTTANLTGPVLVYGNDTQVDQVRTALQTADVPVYQVKSGRELAIDGNRIQVDTANRDAVAALWSQMDTKPSGVLFLQPLDETDHPDLRTLTADLLALIGATSKQGLKQPLRVVVALQDGHNHPELTALAGIGKALKPVLHRFELVTLTVEPAVNALGAAVDQLLAAGNRGGIDARFGAAGHQQRTWVETTPTLQRELPLREGGVYVITGGSGGLGQVFARYLAQHYRAKLVLAGRSSASERSQAQLAALAELGGNAIYVQADIASAEGAQALTQAARDQFGTIHGIFHAAGFLGEDGIATTTLDRFFGPLGPKLYGTLALDEATATDDLDLFVTFGSVSEEMGDFGAGNYAMGNRFLGNFAAKRETARARGDRQGATLNVAWPLWQAGGMSLPEDEAAMYFNYSGMAMLDEATGLTLFEQALQHGSCHVAAAIGDGAKMRRVLGLESEASATVDQPSLEEPAAEQTTTKPATAPVQTSTDDPQTWAEHYLTAMLADTIQLPVERISPRAPFEKYGIDSIVIMDLNERLSESFADLPKTLFFEYDTIRDLATWLVDHRASAVATMMGDQAESSPTAEKTTTPAADVPRPPRPTPVDSPRRPKRQRFRGQQRQTGQTVANQVEAIANNEPIAIIGIAGRYPDARDLDTFWQNLCAGHDAIQPVPLDRWNNDAIYDPEVGKWGHTYGRYGAFIDGVAEFDPLFFNVSPAKADFIDPQERLILESLWQTMEHAGTTREALTGDKRQPRPVGMFVASMYNHYPYLAPDAGLQAALSVNSYSSIANRASYFFNFQGPSLAVDTACSGGLTAVHLACESLRRGDCHVAFAGGINLSIHPNKYVGLSNGQMIGSTTESRCLGDGDGFLPGEGVGTLLLKPLAQATADGDRILAVIRGSAINHGGRTNAFQVPNPNAQARVISQAIERAGLTPDDLDYLEVAANGSSLGDPIEVAAMSKAFSSLPKNRLLPIGTVKSNIGHLEAASGLSQLTKVLLQLNYRRLVPSLHADPPNPNLDLTTTPFRVQTTVEDWQPREATQPLRAGIASFGAGGANTYMILEAPPQQERRLPPPGGVLPWVFSARKADRLRAVVQQMRNHLVNHETPLGDTAFTLAVGRESMAHRLAFLAETRDELLAHLDAFLANAPDPHWHHGAHDLSDPALLDRNDARADAVAAAEEANNLTSLIEAWADGADVEWSRLSLWRGARRVTLPSYPFERRRCWLTPVDHTPTLAQPQPSNVAKPVTPRPEPTTIQPNRSAPVAATPKMPEPTVESPAESQQPTIVGSPYQSWEQKRAISLRMELAKILADDYGKDLANTAAHQANLKLAPKQANQLARQLGQRFDVTINGRTIARSANLTELANQLLALGAKWMVMAPHDKHVVPEEYIPAAVTSHHREDTATTVDDNVIAIFGDLMGLAAEEISLTADLSDYGFDSLAAAKLQHRLQDQFHVELPIRDLATAYNLRELVDRLREMGIGDITKKPAAGEPAAGEPASSGLQTASTATTLIDQVTALFADLMGLTSEEMSIHGDLSDYGFDSLAAAKYQHRLHDHFGVELPMRALATALNLQEVEDLLREQGVAIEVSQPSATDVLHTASAAASKAENTETVLIAMFCDLMGLSMDEVSPTADVAEYGFDSLVASRMLNRINDRFPCQLTMRLFREVDHLRGLASKVTDAIQTAEKPTTVAAAAPAARQTNQDQLKAILTAVKDGKISPAQAAKLRAQLEGTSKEEVHS